MDEIVKRVMDFIVFHDMIETDDRVLLSLSAGKDSMFLLAALSLIKDIVPFEIGVFHLNHMVRGEESDADERHVVSMARSGGFEAIVRHYDFNKLKEHGVSFEEQARDVRYGLLHETAASMKYNRIATAHTKDDDTETVLMRIFAGTGVYGLKGIPPKRGMIIRPLLSLSAIEVYDFLKAHRIAWREDSSNNDSSYSRNFIRNDILPLVRKKFPMVDTSLSSLSNIADETMHLLDELLLEKYPGLVETATDHVIIDANKIIHSRPVFHHIVATILRTTFNQYVNRRILGDIHERYNTAKANAELYANNEIRVRKVYIRDRSMLKINRVRGDEYIPPDWVYSIRLDRDAELLVSLEAIGISVLIKPCDYEYYKNFEKNNSSVFVTLENNVDTIYIRNRRKGDAIRTECGTKKLKDFYIERKLSNSEKTRVPILVVGSTIAAVMPGLLNDTPNRISSDFLVDKKTKRVLFVIARSEHG
jgi:tRNA(Ile)-lysidine synthase